jgi:chromosome segregation ATPase
VRKQHAAAVAEYDAALADRDGAITQLRARQAELETALATEQQQGEERGRRISALEQELEAAEAELATRATTLEERARRLGELEQESARYQDQVLRAYQRIKSDENIVARAKTALAIALTLLEESEPEAGSEQAKS